MYSYYFLFLSYSAVLFLESVYSQLVRVAGSRWLEHYRYCLCPPYGTAQLLAGTVCPFKKNIKTFLLVCLTTCFPRLPAGLRDVYLQEEITERKKEKRKIKMLKVKKSRAGVWFVNAKNSEIGFHSRGSLKKEREKTQKISKLKK